jgi:TonB family protein
MFRPRIAVAPSLTAALLIFASLPISGAFIQTRAQQQPPPSRAISAETARGIKLYQQGDTENAIEVLKEVVKKRRDDADAWYYLGLSYNRAGYMAAARPAFQMVIDLRPDLASAHAYLAYTLLIANRTDAAASEAVYAIGLGEKTAQLHYIIGEKFLRHGELEKALEKANAALEIDPGFSSAIILKSLALVGLKRPREAAEALGSPLFVNSPGNSPAWRWQLEELRRLINTTSANRSDNPARIFTGREVTTKVRILTEPQPSYTDEARRAGIEGTVGLLTVFSSDGTLSRILVFKWLPYGLTERAIEAARSLKFVPATKDGHPVSMYYRIEYNFTLY